MRQGRALAILCKPRRASEWCRPYLAAVAARGSARPKPMYVPDPHEAERQKRMSTSTSRSRLPEYWMSRSEGWWPTAFPLNRKLTNGLVRSCPLRTHLTKERRSRRVRDPLFFLLARPGRSSRLRASSKLCGKAAFAARRGAGVCVGVGVCEIGSPVVEQFVAEAPSRRFG